MIFTFRFISDEEETFVLDVNINHDQTFEQLHKAIQNALDYDASQMASFFTSNDNWEKLEEITLMDMGSDTSVQIMNETKIGDCFTEKNQRILYVFDFFAERLFFGSVSRTIDAEPPIELPSISKHEGKAPEQLSMNNNFDDDILNAIDFSDDLDEGLGENFESLDDIENFDQSEY